MHGYICIVDMFINKLINISIHKGWGLSHGNYFLPTLIDHEETYKWKWMVLGALGCMNNADFGK